MSDASKRLEEADKYLQKGKVEDALSELLAAVDDDPENNLVCERAADICISQNRHKDAAGLLAGLFDRLSASGDQAKALITYKKLARISTPRVEQTFRFAQYLEKSNKKEAAEQFQKAAEGFVAAGQKNDALAAYKRLVALEPTLPNLKAAGELAQAAGDAKTAAAAFFQAGELEKKEERDGHAWFERAYNLDSNNPDTALAYSDSLVARGDGATALRVVQPLAKKDDAPELVQQVYARALLAQRRPKDAEPIIRRLYEKDHKKSLDVALLIGGLLDAGDYRRALEIARQTSDLEDKAGRNRDFVGMLKEIIDKHPPNTEFLEYMVTLFNATNREHDYCDALGKLFQLYYAAGNYLKAGDCLDAAAEVDPYEKEHQKRLELLKGKIDANRYRAIANRFSATVRSGQGAVADESPQPVANENAVDNIARVTEITRNIYRQSNVKAVLFASVNDVGRHWNASRCVAGLCTPGKPPSAALEYCAPGVKQSDVMAIVKLIGTLQALAVGQGAVVFPNVKNAPELAAIRQWTDTLEVESLLAVPLLDGEEHAGILILEQCAAARVWRQTDVLVLKTIADQIVLAVNNAKLRNLMKTLAVTDEKSGLLKRSSYIDVLLSEVRRGLQQNSAASVMLLHFGRASPLVKEIGEPGVESMMQQIGQICCSHIRQNDVAVRYDLTTIALVLADTNDKNAFFVVDKLRKVLATVKVPGTDRAVNCTVGIAEAVMQVRFDPVDIVTEAINRVEAALDAARHEGGNKAMSLAPVLEAAAVAY